MRIRRKLAGILAILLIAACAAPSGYSRAEKEEGKETPARELPTAEKLYDPSSGVYDILLHFSDSGVTELSRKERAARQQKAAIAILEEGKSAQTVESYESYYISNAIHAVIRGESVLEQLSRLPQIDRIAKNEKVELIEPVQQKRRGRRSLLFVPKIGDVEWGVSMIHADTARDAFAVDGSGVTVGIIDTGVNYRLDAIKRAYKGYDPETDTFDPSYYKDFVDGLEEPQASHVNDHGTHVAGTICGAGTDGFNRIGVAPGAKFISARVLDDNGSDASVILSAAQWMLEMRPDIINNSWGGASDADPWFSDIAAAWREAGIVPVFAAGNQLAGEGAPGPGSIANPGNLLHVFSVGAVDRQKKLGSFSKKGPSAFDETGEVIKPDVSAPGVQVRSIDALGSFVSWNGTSMAAPHVAGAFALLKQAAPSLTVDEQEQIIRASAEPLTDAAYDRSPNMAYGHGLVNVYDAIGRAKGNRAGEIYGFVYKEGEDKNPAAVVLAEPEAVYAGRDFKVVARVSDDVSVKTVTLSYQVNGGEKKQVDMKMAGGDVADGTYEAVIPSGELQPGRLSYTVTATDFAGADTPVSKETTIRPGAVIPAVFDFESETPGLIVDGRWGRSDVIHPGEPDMPDTGRAYMGIDAGVAAFKTRVDSYLYLPPVDLDTADQEKKTALMFDQYQGFTGISTAQVQVSRTGQEDDWHVLYDAVIRPDIEKRAWSRDSFDLGSYTAEGGLLHIRFYFYGHDADEGCGWYIDNIRIQNGEDIPPQKVTGLTGTLDGDGFALSFQALEHTDMARYLIERRTLPHTPGGSEAAGAAAEGTNGEKETAENSEEDFSQVADIGAEEGRQFIQPDEGLTYYRMTWQDGDVRPGEQYEYRVRAVDSFGNRGPVSDILIVDMAAYTYDLSESFDEGDGGFVPSALEGEISDWQWGRPERPAEEEGGYLYEEAWEHLLANTTPVWGLALTGPYSGHQNSALTMPAFLVKDSHIHLFFASYDTVSSYDRTTFTVEVRKENSPTWHTLVSKEEIQDNRTLRSWKKIEKSLAGYAGERIELRFRAVSGGTFIGAADLGWYIDDVMIGSPRTTFTQTRPSMETEGAAKPIEAQGAPGSPVSLKPGGIPLGARVKVLETGRYTYASERDGSYRIPITANEAGSPYTVEFSAYGYETKRLSVDLTAEEKALREVVLSPASRYTLSGVITDPQGQPIEGATIRVDSDSNVPAATSGPDGAFRFEQIYGGQVTLRAYGEGYRPQMRTITLSEDTSMDAFVLSAYEAPADGERIQDRGSTPRQSEGTYQTIHFRGSMKGAAVRFQSPTVGGRLAFADIFFVNNGYYRGKEAMVGVLAYNDHGRLVELSPFTRVEDLKPNEWNRISFNGYDLTTDKPVYVAVIYPGTLDGSAGVYYDTDADERAVSYSYVYDGSFTPVSRIGQPGAYGMRAGWIVPSDGADNPETQVEETGGNPDEMPDNPLSEDDFTVTDEGVITGYTGGAVSLRIPRSIRGIRIRGIGEGAFAAKNRPKGRKLTGVELPEGVTFIGPDAFRGNNLQNISLPKSLETIGEGAFADQWKDGYEDRSLSIHIPDKVTNIPERAFANSGSPLVVTGMEQVTDIAGDAFAGNRQVTLCAPRLERVADQAFGPAGNGSMEYAVIYTDTKLSSRDGEYLVNPAIVRIDLTDAADSERIYRRALRYGPDNPPARTRDLPASSFYRMGEEVTVEPPLFRYDGMPYISVDQPVGIRLQRENQLAFFYYPAKPLMREPLLETDDSIMGFSVPGAHLLVEAGGKTYETTANEDGYFFIGLPLADAGELTVHVNGKYDFSWPIKANPGGDYIAENGKILRYLGSEGPVNIPSYIEGAGDIRTIGPFAFAGIPVGSVRLSAQIETVEAGAFMGAELEEMTYETEDPDRSSLRAVHAYAFRDNRLTHVRFGELFHVVRTEAFANNHLEEVTFGKYLGHIGRAAFRNNRLEELVIPGNVEELGEQAFMDNQLTSVRFTAPPPKGSDAHFLTHIPSLAFANNRLTAVEWPKTVTEVAEDALAGNTVEEPADETGERSEEPADETGGRSEEPADETNEDRGVQPGNAPADGVDRHLHTRPSDHFLNREAQTLPEGNAALEIQSLPKKIAPHTGDDGLGAADALRLVLFTLGLACVALAAGVRLANSGKRD